MKLVSSLDKSHLKTRDRVGESLTSSSLNSFSRYLVFSKIPRNTFSWQSMLAMIPTAISFTLVPGKEYRLREVRSKPVVGIAEQLHKDVQSSEL